MFSPVFRHFLITSEKVVPILCHRGQKFGVLYRFLVFSVHVAVNTTNFSTLYSVQNRFFSTLLRQYGLLSRHLSVPQLQQNPQHYTPSLRQALRSNPSPSLPDTFRYIHPESVIYAGLPYQPLPEQYPQHKPYDAETAVWQLINPHIQFQLQQSYNVFPLSIRQHRNIFYDRNHCGKYIRVFITSS